MTIRREVYLAIDSERNYQEWRFPAVNGISASPEGFLLVVEELSAQARAQIVQGNLPPLGNGHVALEFLRKIAATAVRAMEQHGAPQRSAESVPAVARTPMDSIAGVGYGGSDNG